VNAANDTATDSTSIGAAPIPTLSAMMLMFLALGLAVIAWRAMQ
jgi:hypothetical protein